ncbi:aminotransferase class IV [Pararhodobacter zhoushanensis]|uniref:Probable branched-chain-amino-acid aminotransferase n=1 Tax=Pararhodobacter zhoushanensis TaxID=2479545 RepID=A0ABT3GTG5_9RHOB|nr:aminotransferase class IV [Pararhodobacter zhoushanensis]MCW1930825.1 aminotransferase class IV [Pararhodobacter zhoushanensis]
MESRLRGADEPGLKLIETMLWDGSGVALESLHRARLLAGAQALGWSCPAFVLKGPAHPARLRLTLDAGGTVALESGPLSPMKDVWRLALSRERLTSTDPWLRVKSTRRAAYDRARAELPEGIDEVILLNERGEVCDGSISTLFFDRGNGLRTPPLSAGLLPGVLRASLAVPEETLLPGDLPLVRLWIGNALRGFCPARWVG